MLLYIPRQHPPLPPDLLFSFIKNVFPVVAGVENIDKQKRKKNKSTEIAIFRSHITQEKDFDSSLRGKVKA